ILSCQLAQVRVAGEQLGTDVLLSLMNRLVGQAASAIERYAGTLTVVSHDGFVAVFGAPIAHEDHARRAVLAALELQARLDTVADQQRPAGVAPIQLRIGLHSGLVAFGRIASPRSLVTVVGGAMDIAMTLQRSAAPGMIVVSETTAAQVMGYVNLEPLRAVT